MIGVFDSGSGGLLVLRAIREELPDADLLYFGDLAHAPYGEKSRAELFEVVTNAVAELRRAGATSVVSACNTASTVLQGNYPELLGLPRDRFVEMIEPTVARAAALKQPLLLAATPATIASGVYQSALNAAGVVAKSVALPGLAAAIEFGAPEEELENRIRDAFLEIDTAAYGGLVLACTHYLLARSTFERVFPKLVVLDPTRTVSKRVRETFGRTERGGGAVRFRASADVSLFRRRVRAMFGPDTPIEADTWSGRESDKIEG